MTRLIFAVVLLTGPLLTSTLENGLARSPPMGWLAWERFRCNIDCENDPDNCISEKLFMTMADLLVSEGYSDLGYEYINVDDCWMSMERDASGKLQADPDRFPSGMKALGDYIHSKGLKYGIYEDYGTHTCEGYPGVIGHMETDANSFAEWGVDYVKLDGCYSNITEMDEGYPEFGRWLNKTGRPMMYSCSWPVYQIISGITPNWTSIIGTCNLWRNWYDIQDSWASLTNIIDYYGDNQDDINPNAGPGHWNDPDMLIIGNFGLSYEQSKSQFALWAIFASPLLMSNDLRTMRPEYKAILQNKDIIGVNQDHLGIQGRRIYKNDGIEIWTRPISPMVGASHSYAVLFHSRRTDGTPRKFTISNKDLGLTHQAGYNVKDLYSGEDLGRKDLNDTVTVYVNPSGVVMLKYTAN